jgi:hypothetical protein
MPVTHHHHHQYPVPPPVLTPSPLLPPPPQYQTEQYFIEEGMLLPKFHKNYWMGLRSTTDAYPTFNWVDPLISGGPQPEGYNHWGTFT